MLVLGPHISIAKGYTKAGEDALSIGATTFQFFTRNPRGGNAKALDPGDVRGLTAMVEAQRLGPLLAHAPYTLNMASATPATRDFARRAFKEDLERLDQLPCALYNFHPGSHVGQGVTQGIQWIVKTLDEVMTPGQKTTVLLEAMAGKGSEIGRNFEELKAIMDGVADASHLGVCLDTCHIYSAGYDIAGNLEGVLEDFDKRVGLHRLKAIHLNDSLTPFASHKDRHAALGKGSLGIETFKNLVTHRALAHLPFFLETPQEAFGDYAEEIKLLRAVAEG